MRVSCAASAVAYIISGLLDAVDGHAARLLDQSTKFGAMLDMLVDRCASMCLLACLIVFYTEWMFAFQLVMIVDIASHWLHVHSSIAGGAQSHKTVDFSKTPLLRIYYQNRIVLFLMCLGNEMFYCSLYFYHFYPQPTYGISLWAAFACLSAPVALGKFVINLLQLGAAALNMTNLDVMERQQKLHTQ
ncbi:CDP-diacylglycerol--inositol 3-phosphatidyltransferase [Fasciola gigantica]|uniref:CDP-diacylglycerol--inositol 3-phosphatidyltransferase n=1 Tax=Fasciola gigantica TaxID=46835 RepID=A0A504Z523_FASGI|nr:CDP-diacylglycerol--inositol 3-phosphatidyltransferase [Fasciola gigantica]